MQRRSKSVAAVAGVARYSLERAKETRMKFASWETEVATKAGFVV